MVRVAGLEPTASWTRTMRATSCATPGNLFYYSLFHSICQEKMWKSNVAPVGDYFRYFAGMS